DIVIANGSGMVGKKVKAQIERVLPGAAYATIVKRTKDGAAPITAEGEAEKPTRRPATKKPVEAAAEAEAEEKTAAGAAAKTDEAPATDAPAKKRTGRGSRGGRRRKKTPTIHVPESGLGTNGSEPDQAPEPEAVAETNEGEMPAETPAPAAEGAA